MNTPISDQLSGKVEVVDGMRIAWDVPIPAEDGTILRADVFRPVSDAPVPVLLTYGPYGKGMRFSEHHPEHWERLVVKHPEVLEGSSNKYQAWETPDPERWIPRGYAYVRIDSRGAGRSPGFLAPNSPQETRDIYACIEWAGTQPWSTGRVGMLGISYYAANSWRVAALNPPHLAAICAWEGNADAYRDASRHGGILTTWAKDWWASRILPMQHGRGERGPRSPNNGELVTGPETMSDAELEANRVRFSPERNRHVLDDDWWRERAVDWQNVTTPFLSAGNWGGAGLHLRGNIEGFVRAASEHKWLEVHGNEHWTEFYGGYGLDLQHRFMDCYLNDNEGAWESQSRVTLNIRRPGGQFICRGESSWPLEGTQWTKFFLEPRSLGLVEHQPTESAAVPFEALGEGLRFVGEPMAEETELTGPVAARLHVSSTTTDADLFLVLQVFDPDGGEVTFQGAMDPFSSIGKGWLRASRRKLDVELTEVYRPYHTHDESQPLSYGEIYQLDIEIWPTSIVIPVGYRLALSVLGRDYLHAGDQGGSTFESFGQRLGQFGSGGMIHSDPSDRPSAVFGGTTTLHSGGAYDSFVLVPVVPPRQ